MHRKNYTAYTSETQVHNSSAYGSSLACGSGEDVGAPGEDVGAPGTLNMAMRLMMLMTTMMMTKTTVMVMPTTMMTMMMVMDMSIVKMVTISMYYYQLIQLLP